MTQTVPATFYQRAAAWGLDFWPWMVPLWVFSGSIIGFVITVLLCTMGYAGLSAYTESQYGTTIGKYLVGLKVQTQHQRRQTFVQALARHVSASVSWLTLNVGHGLMFFRQDKKTLHDLMTQTQVLEDLNDEADVPFMPYISPKQHKQWMYGSLIGQGVLTIGYTIYVVHKALEVAQKMYATYPVY